MDSRLLLLDTPCSAFVSLVVVVVVVAFQRLKEVARPPALEPVKEYPGPDLDFGSLSSLQSPYNTRHPSTHHDCKCPPV